MHWRPYELYRWYHSLKWVPWSIYALKHNTFNQSSPNCDIYFLSFQDTPNSCLVETTCALRLICHQHKFTCQLLNLLRCELTSFLTSSRAAPAFWPAAEQHQLLTSGRAAAPAFDQQQQQSAGHHENRGEGNEEVKKERGPAPSWLHYIFGSWQTKFPKGSTWVKEPMLTLQLVSMLSVI